MNLTSIGKSYDKMEKATVHGAIEFSSKGGNMNSIQAKGEAALCMATWWKFPCSDFWGKPSLITFLDWGHLINYKISRADCDFSIEKGYVRTSNFVAQGSNMFWRGRLDTPFRFAGQFRFRWGFAVCRGLLLPRFSCWPEGCFKCGERAFEQSLLNFAPFSGGKAPVPPAAAPARKR